MHGHMNVKKIKIKRVINDTVLGADRTDLSQDRDKYWAVVKAEVIVLVP